jgi:hypothetical protein
MTDSTSSRGSTSSSETDVTESRNSLELDQRRLCRSMRCWPNSTRTSPRAGRPQTPTPTSPRDTRWAATVRFHVRPRTPNSTSPRPATVRFTSGQLGKPNNDTRLPQERLFKQIKPAPKRGYSPSRKHAFSVWKDPRTDRQTLCLDRAARAVPRRRGAGQYVGLDGSARRIGRSARCRSRPGRRSVPRRRGSSTTRCWPVRRPRRVGTSNRSVGAVGQYRGRGFHVRFRTRR